jgi:hypothetical protein
LRLAEVRKSWGGPLGLKVFNNLLKFKRNAKIARILLAEVLKGITTRIAMLSIRETTGFYGGLGKSKDVIP